MGLAGKMIFFSCSGESRFAPPAYRLLSTVYRLLLRHFPI